MKIALIGYGKMGKIIETICLERGHQIIERFDANHPFGECKQLDADVAIEFTSPELAVDHIKHAAKLGIPIVVGTTGWYEKFQEVKNCILDSNGSMFYATNFSIGVNLFFQLNKVLARLMSSHTEYKLSMTEIHHTEKKDAPSGTAITLAEGIIAEYSGIETWNLVTEFESNTSIGLNSQSNSQYNQSDSKQSELVSIPIFAERMPGVPGTHIIKYESHVDTIEIRHDAKNRLGFALGSVLASEWLIDKKGIFSMSDMLSL